MDMHKVGIMGGTFNPIHYAHLVLAERAFEHYQLDQVWFLLSKHPPHKPNCEIASDEHRCKMLQLAIDDNPHFRLSKLELERKGMTYTVDTLRILNENYPDTEFYFIIGGDSLVSFKEWRAPKEIARFSHIVATTRDEMTKTDAIDQVKKLNQWLGCKNGCERISLFNVPRMDISSHQIREAVVNGQSIRYLLPMSVLLYIREQQLFTRNNVEIINHRLYR